MTIKAYASAFTLFALLAPTAQAQVTARVPSSVRPALPTAKAAPPSLPPAAKLQMLQTMMKGSAPTTLGAPFTLSTRVPMIPGQGAITFQNAVNTFPGAFDGTQNSFPDGFTDFRNTNNGGTPFGNGRLRLSAKAGQGLIVDCKVDALEPVFYQLYAADGGSTQSTVTLPTTGSTQGHLVIPVPKAGTAGIVDITFRPAASGNDMTVYSCEISSY